MNVLSLFDGMSCGRIALERAGIPVNNYYASEIDKYAMKVSAANYPDITQLGSVTELKNIDWNNPKIDLLIGGSPCQGFSFAGKQLNFEDPRSKLFFEYVRVLEEIRLVNPEVKFFLENVKMKKEYQDVISGLLGVQPIEVNSALVSAQNRKRLYWTNIEGFLMPEDKGILLKDIVHEYCLTDRDKSHCIISSIGRTTEREYFQKNQGQMVFDCSQSFNINPSGKGMNGNVYPVSKEKSNCLTTNKGEGQKISISLEEYIVPFEKTLQILDKEVQRGKVGYFRKDSQANRVYYIHDKAVTLCGDAGGGAAKMGQYLFGTVEPTIHQAAEATVFGSQPRQQDRIYNIEGKSIALHLDASRTNIAVPLNPEIDEDYLFGYITPDRVETRQNGQRFNDGKKFYTLTAQDKHGVLIEGYIRKLTPVECERLQTVPDNYTNHVSNSQRYKMLGNGWTINVVTEFFKNLKNNNFRDNLDF